MSIYVAAKNAAANGLGEGPHWEEKTQTLVYVDIIGGAIHKFDSKIGLDRCKKLDKGKVGFVIPMTSGGYVIGLKNTISFWDWDSGDVTTCHEVETDTKNRFNDAKCDPSGRLWAGTMGHIGEGQRVPEGGLCHLYSMDKNRELKSHQDGIDISNGLAWSQDNKTMYYIDSVPRKVSAFDFDINEGTISNQRTVIDYQEGTISSLGYPDGMCIDTEGKLWVACFGVGKVIRWDPETGKALKTLQFPAMDITSCCFGGKNYDELYVTSGAYNLKEEDWKQYPLSGSVFKVKELGVKGMAPSVYDG